MSEVQTTAPDTPPAAEATTTSEAAPAAEAQVNTEAPATEAQTETTEPVKAAEAKPVVPEKYDLKLPEGSKLPESHLESIASYAKEQGLSNEVAQRMLNRENEIITNLETAQLEALKAKSTEWVNQLKADKEYGGENFKRTAEYAKRAIDFFGDDEVKAGFNKTGIGNHPSFVKMFAKMGEAMANDKFFATNADGSTERSEDRLYPTMKKK